MSLFEKLLGPQPSSPLITSAFSDIEGMLSQSRRMLEIALATLIDNQELTEDLDRLDDAVDQGERLVRRAVLQHLSVSPGEELVSSLVLVSIVQDCERIGDFARGLGDIVELAEADREGAFRDRLDTCRASLMPLFDRTSKAFSAGDSDQAGQVVEAAVAVKAELNQFVRDIAKSDLNANMAVVYSASARILGRVSSHLSNVCSTVVQPYDRMRHEDEDA